ncbi:MAG: hypothetical protein ABIR79_25685 [Candidatus Binatia bacterium]
MNEGRALPVVIDVHQVLRRLAVEEEERRRELVRLEARLREFEDVERPAYTSWVRLELGPVVTRVEEVMAALRAQTLLADRVDELVAVHGLHPREALHAARTGGALDEERDAVAARRQAKLDRKRAERKQAKRARRGGAAPKPEAGGGAGSPVGVARLVTLYRGLARRLHPDSPTAIRGLDPARLRTVWAEVQAAYAARNLERLLALSAWLETEAAAGGDGSEGGDDGALLVSVGERHVRLRALRGACRALERRLAELASDPAWGFPSVSTAVRRALKQAAAERLAAELDELGLALREVEDFIAAIGAPRAPQTGQGKRGRRR